jgi:hypothetical protein
MALAAVGVLAVLAVVVAAVLYTAHSADQLGRDSAVCERQQDPNAEYLSDGLTESIINSLSQLPNLKSDVAQRGVSFKGSNHDPLEAGRSLNVGAVLTGRLVKLDDRWLSKPS